MQWLCPSKIRLCITYEATYLFEWTNEYSQIFSLKKIAMFVASIVDPVLNIDYDWWMK